MKQEQECLRRSSRKSFLFEHPIFSRAAGVRGASARDAIGEPIDASSVFARRWSIAGALERVWRRSTFDPDVALSAFVRATLATKRVELSIRRWRPYSMLSSR